MDCKSSSITWFKQKNKKGQYSKKKKIIIILLFFGRECATIQWSKHTGAHREQMKKIYNTGFQIRN